MPSGQTHDRITLWGLPWLVLCIYATTRSSKLTLIVGGAYLFAGLMFGPDLDIHSVQFKRWGCLRWIWLPYQKSLNHRSVLSHGLLIGTTIRILYLAAIVLMLGVLGIALAQVIWNFDWNWRSALVTGTQTLYQNYRLEAIALFVGLEIGAMSHAFSDWLGSMLKYSRKQGWTAMFKANSSKSQIQRKRRRKASKKR